MITAVPRLRRAAGARLALVLILCGMPWSQGQAARAQDQVLFLSVVDTTGNAVTDLQPGDVFVRWDGADGEILDLDPITLPLRVTVFIDNGGSAQTALQHIREGLMGFVDAMPEDVEVALLTVGERPRWITRHTSNHAELRRGLGLVVSNAGAGARYLDAWVEEANRLADDKERQYFPIVVMLASDGPDDSTVTQGRYAEMAERMMAASATLHTWIFTRGNLTAPQVQIGIEMADLTGGSYQALAASSAFVTQLPELGWNIALRHGKVRRQYRVTYAPPDVTSEQPVISVGSTRLGIDIIGTIDGNVP